MWCKVNLSGNKGKCIFPILLQKNGTLNFFCPVSCNEEMVEMITFKAFHYSYYYMAAMLLSVII